ncbi:CHAD domain-containing protein [Arthrobacter sp. Br18]|uniref:CHAD domain-containing protein n=1 Tax=Arthrobacter sp. Br18 TaxID=1312954 RepID=UPI0004B781D1|nr:CHAD domain-containing protein [Arthrobacter sp. Br18]
MLTAAGIRPAHHGSKLARALGTHLHTISERPSAPTANGPASDVLLAYLGEQISVLRQQDPRVRLDAHDAVHRMRVATRRMRSVLATYRTLLEDAQTVGLLRAELKWLAGVLGQARDAEVMHGRLKDMLGKEPVELLMGPVARRVDIELGGGYRKAHTQVLEALDEQRYFLLLDMLESLMSAPALTPLGTKPARRIIPTLINRDIKRLRAAVREARN